MVFFLETSQQSWQLKTSEAIEKACFSLHLHTDQSQLVTKFVSNSLSNSQHQKGGVESQIVANGRLQGCSRYVASFENLLGSGFNSSTVSSTSWVAASRASADDHPLGTSPRLCQHGDIVDLCRFESQISTSVSKSAKYQRTGWATSGSSTWRGKISS